MTGNEPRMVGDSGPVALMRGWRLKEELDFAYLALLGRTYAEYCQYFHSYRTTWGRNGLMGAGVGESQLCSNRGATRIQGRYKWKS